MGANGGREDGYYRGTIGLNIAVPDRPRELVLVALDLWDHAVVLRGAMALNRAAGWPPAFGVSTDDGTSLTSKGGGGGSTGWHSHFEPTIPSTAQEIQVFVGPDGQPLHERTLPDDPTLVVALPELPVAVQRSAATLDTTAVTSRTGQIPSLEGGPVHPDGVLPVSTRLEVVGRDLNVLSVELYPSWFFVHLAGSGGLGGLMSGGTVRVAGSPWTAEDDRGGRYAGIVKHASSGFPWIVSPVFTPALDPAATRLRLEISNPFGAGVVRTSVDLPVT